MGLGEVGKQLQLKHNKAQCHDIMAAGTITTGDYYKAGTYTKSVSGFGYPTTNSQKFYFTISLDKKVSGTITFTAFTSAWIRVNGTYIGTGGGELTQYYHSVEKVNDYSYKLRFDNSDGWGNNNYPAVGDMSVSFTIS